MTITKAIPELWSGAIKQALLDAHVFGQAGVVNRDYEGLVSEYGDTVRVISLSPVTIKTYTKNTAIDAPELLTDAETVLTVDQAHYFNFGVDDIDQAQTRPKLMGEASRLAAWGLSDKSDTYIADAMWTDTLAGNKKGAVTVSAVTGMYNLLVDLDVLLSQQNVPGAGRWAVLTPAMYAVLRKDDRFLHATGAGDDILRGGTVGMAAGFSIRLSNNVHAIDGDTFVLQAGHNIAWSFVEQILKTEPYRPQGYFSDALKGLYVFGGKTMYAEALASAEVTITV